jgi:SAM-dependent methyltransferase
LRAHVAAFVAGAGVMALELLAGRWLAPGFGATLTAWTCVIAVTLLAGALGAWAAASPRCPGAGTALVVAALLVALEGALAPSLVDALASVQGVGGALAAAGALLLVPVAALACVVPTLLARADAPKPGPLIAVSTAGALAGTLATGLLAIPSLGLRTSAWVTAALLLAGACTQVRGRRGAGGVAALVLLVGFAVGVGGGGSGLVPGEIVVRETLAGRVSLTREPSGYALRVDGVLQGMGGSQPVDGAALVRLGQHVGVLPYLRPTARTALLVGLGTGAYGRALARHGIAVTTLDVSADLVAIVREHLGDPGDVRVGDARALWRRLGGGYDLIVLDAFQGEGLPAHVLTVEALRELAERLAPDGIVALHLIAPPDHALVGAVARTLQAVWPHLLALRSGGGPGDLEDLVLLAAAAPLALPPHPDLLAAGLDAHDVFMPPRAGDVLTDDRSALETLHEPLARALRARNRARTGPQVR